MCPLDTDAPTFMLVTKTSILEIQGQITHERSKWRKRKYGGAQWHMVSNIAMKFQGCRPYGYWVTRDTKSKSSILEMQGQITHERSKWRKRKYGGAQWHMVSNIAIKFQGCRAYGKWVAAVRTDGRTKVNLYAPHFCVGGHKKGCIIIMR